MWAVRCELLMGSYQAADPFGAADVVEWPPHPFRLHAALVSAACEAGGEHPSTEHVQALRWLEAQPPPLITCSADPPRRTVAMMWVPRNPTRGGEWDRYFKAGQSVSRVGRVFPTAVPADPVVTLTWPETDGVPESLEPLVQRVSWLGSSRSPVACAAVREPPAPTFVPSAAGAWQVRVAAHGVTDALLEARFTHPQPVAARVAGYTVPGAGEGTETGVAAGPMSELLVRRTVGATQDAADSALLGSALRAAVLARAGDEAPAALHGHDPARDHAAYLTLVDVGHTGARGAVRGMALGLPAGLTPGERAGCLRAFVAVDRVTLPGGRRPLRLEDDAGDLWTLAAERWVGPAIVWSTVTPVILDRFPRRDRTPRDELLASVANAGLPAPADVELFAGPPLTGAPPAGGLRGDVPPGMRVHARLRFHAAVRGPLVVGRGRFRGVGLFQPWPRL